ncbi:MAG: thiamine phosphate synthase [Betaproteobacteria bacterium]|nr:thiamine phosphate synthase [Betaproteobacteria bacterium]
MSSAGTVSSARLKGLYAITPDGSQTPVLMDKVRAAIRGGARVVQYRDKSGDPARRRLQATGLLELCRAAGAALIINDDLALTLEIGADGVHLGRGDGDIAATRRALGPDRLLGASCYDRIELAERALGLGADHVAFGSVFASPTKPGAKRAPLDLFTESRKRIDAPIVAIGGITVGNAGQVIAAGAHAIAVISALFDAPDVEERAREFALLFGSAAD